MCGLSTVVTPAGASLTMYREIRSYANSIWDDNNNNNILRIIFVPRSTRCMFSLPLGIREMKPLSASKPLFRRTRSQLPSSVRPSQALLAVPGDCWDAVCAFCSPRETCLTDPIICRRTRKRTTGWSAEQITFTSLAFVMFCSSIVSF